MSLFTENFMYHHKRTAQSDKAACTERKLQFNLLHLVSISVKVPSNSDWLATHFVTRTQWVQKVVAQAA